MRERPILFSAPMVRAILAGRKVQTRRLVKHPHIGDADTFAFDPERGEWEMGECHQGPVAHVDWMRCPYGVPGDRLWVRETFVYRHKYDRFYYRADHPKFDPYAHDGWKPSIHMPRRACRLVLEVLDVRIERLKKIDDAEAVLEGARYFPDLPLGPLSAVGSSPSRWSMEEPSTTDECLGSPRFAFANLWNKLNGPEAWATDPWVWVVTFRRVAP